MVQLDLSDLRSSPPALLTELEQEVAVLLAAGYSEHEIACRIEMLPAEIVTLSEAIRRKLGILDPALLSRWAIVHKLLPRSSRSIT